MQQRDARVERQLEPEARRGAHALRSAPRGRAGRRSSCSRSRRTPAAPDRGGAARPRRACRTPSATAARCPGTRPSTEPRWLASASRSSTCAPCARRARRAGGSCPSRSGRRRRASEARRQRLELGDDGAAEVAVAALEDVDAKADLLEHGRERAAALAAAPAVDERRPLARLVEHVALDVARRRCARPAPRRASSPRTPRPACTRCRSPRARRRRATAS